MGRLSSIESKAAALQDVVPASSSSPGIASSDHQTAGSAPDDTAPAITAAASPQRPQVTLPPLPVLVDTPHPADLSHLLDPNGSGGQTPLPFVSRRSLQVAVDGLTDNFRVWLDAIYQSIITALQNKADTAHVDFIVQQVQDAAGRASESVASFAKRALGGRCASCDAPLPDESMLWKRPLPTSSQGRWMPKPSGAMHAIRPPTGSMPTRSPLPLPACGASRLPKLQDFRQSDSGDGRICRDFPKGKVLRTAASDPQLRLLRQPDFSLSL